GGGRNEGGRTGRRGSGGGGAVRTAIPRGRPATARTGQHVDRNARRIRRRGPGQLRSRGWEDLPALDGVQDGGLGDWATVTHDVGTPASMGASTPGSPSLRCERPGYATVSEQPVSGVIGCVDG